MSLAVDRILLFGDSHIEFSSDQQYGFGLAPALQHEYARKLQVISRGFWGYNTEHARHILGPILKSDSQGDGQIRLAVVEFGTNDCSHDPQVAVPVDRYIENMKYLGKTFKDRGIPVVLIGAALCDEPNSDSDDDSNEKCLRYSDAAKRAAAEINVPYLDIAREFLYSIGWKDGDPIDNFTPTSLRHLFAPDAVHFSGDGYRVWFNSLRRLVHETYPELQSSKLPQILPNIDDIDNENLPESLFGRV